MIIIYFQVISIVLKKLINNNKFAAAQIKKVDYYKV
jgi:hypothetical protein